MNRFFFHKNYSTKMWVIDQFYFGHGTFFFFTVLWKYNSLPIQFTHLKWTIQWFLVYSQHCATIATISFQNISITSKRNPIPTKKQSVPFPCLPAVGNSGQPLNLSILHIFTLQFLPLYISLCSFGVFLPFFLLLHFLLLHPNPIFQDQMLQN